ncbi:MAG: zinc ribbon domain-containing protein [Candidatus Adiutrix sp.]|jgi:hypothetical protein|nr:zinc ribbon domain-containing protein [Candidatus Adiutrix sp.]
MSLECENCGHRPAGAPCEECHEAIPLWAKYCPYCGQAVKRADRPEDGGDPFAIENRRLCPDGNCIGILGADGRCVVCGKSE